MMHRNGPWVLAACLAASPACRGNVPADTDEKAPAESENAMQALRNIGIENVEPEDGQFDELQQTMADFNREMAVDGAYPLDLYEEMLGHIDEFRNGDQAAGE